MSLQLAASRVEMAASTSATTASNLSKCKANDALIPPINSRHAVKTTRQDAIDLAIQKQLEKTDKKLMKLLQKKTPQMKYTFTAKVLFQ